MYCISPLGQLIPSQLLQSWSNLRNLAGKLTPAQQQQLARTNQLTFQQQQQMLAQQYLFQQALLRNPLLQAQSLRMAQQFQQAALLQQQQQQALMAGLKAGTVNPPSTTAARVNPVVGSAQDGSKLLVSMAPGAASLPVTSVSESESQSGSKAATGNAPSKSAGKSQRQNAANSGLKGQAHSGSGRSSGQTNGRGFSSGHSKTSCQQVTSNSGQSNSSVGLTSRGSDKHHHPRNSKSSAKPNGGSSTHHSAITGLDRKPRQKPSK